MKQVHSYSAVALRSANGAYVAVAWNPGEGLGIEGEPYSPVLHGPLARGVPYHGKWCPAGRSFLPEKKGGAPL